MTRMLIGLCGLAGSGKSTVGRILCHHHNFMRKPFAFPLKRMVAALGVPADDLDGPSCIKEMPCAALGGRTIRHTLQTLGTEWGRQHMGEDFWVELWARGVEHMPRIVADDVRFPNEAEAIRKLGGLVVRIDRPGAGSVVGAAHASENIAALVPDVVIANGRSEDHLFHEVAWLISVLDARRAA